MARVRRKITNSTPRAIQVAGRWIQPGNSEVFELEQLPPEWRSAGVEVPDTTVKKVPAMIPEGTEPLTLIPSSRGVDILDPVSGAALPLTQNLSPAGFKPSVLASLVAGATASQSGTTVTILATGHGVPATKNGSRFYFAGSASIPAGWYDGLTWVDANTLTFQRAASATVPAESINGGTALTGVLVKAVTFQLPGGALGDNGRVRANILRTGDTGAGIKTIRMFIGNVSASACTGTTYPCGTASMTVWSKQSQTAQIAVAANDGNLSSSFQILSANTTVDFTVDLFMSVASAPQWVALDAVDLEVVRR